MKKIKAEPKGSIFYVICAGANGERKKNGNNHFSLHISRSDTYRLPD